MFLGMMLVFALALPASAQQVTSSASSGASGATVPSNIPSFFSATMAKPDFSAISRAPQMSPGLNIASMMPTFGHFQNLMLLRNVSIGPQAVVQMQSYQTPPPPPKKKTPLFLP